MIDPPRWTDDQLSEHLARSIELFRKERLEEDVTGYGEFFDIFQSHFEDLLEKTVDLMQLEANALDILSDQTLRASLRYLAGPPISEDDLEVIADAVLSPARLREDQAMVERVIQVIMAGLDRRRFPWVREGREPEEPEKQAALIASAALMAHQKIGTKRRTESSSVQEEKVKKELLTIGFTEIAAKEMRIGADAPKPGEFCGEAKLSGRKADFTIGLFDRRIMPVECKVWNSAVNSIKRLNNDAAVKAVGWRKDLGDVNVVPVAILSGVYKLSHLKDAQGRGLTLFWAHDLHRLIRFIKRTKRKA
jgi:hypothetical protein